MKTKLKISLLLGIFILSIVTISAPARAEGEVYGLISGSVEVKDEEIKYIRDKILVIIYTKDSKKVYGKMTLDREGNFQYGGIEEGTYVVRFQSDDYGSAYYNNVDSFGEATEITIDSENIKVENISATLEKGVNAESDVTLPSELSAYFEDEEEEEEAVNESILIVSLIVLGILVVGEAGYIVISHKKKNIKSTNPEGPSGNNHSTKKAA